MRKSQLNFVPRLASASIVPLGQAGITCGSADTTAGMAMPTAGRRDGGNSRHGPVRDGSLPDTRTVVTGMCIRKATGDSSCNCCRLCIEAALLAAVAIFGQVPAGWPRSDLPTNNGLNGIGWKDGVTVHWPGSWGRPNCGIADHSRDTPFLPSTSLDRRHPDAQTSEYHKGEPRSWQRRRARQSSSTRSAGYLRCDRAGGIARSLDGSSSAPAAAHRHARWRGWSRPRPRPWPRSPPPCVGVATPFSPAQEAPGARAPTGNRRQKSLGQSWDRPEHARRARRAVEVRRERRGALLLRALPQPGSARAPEAEV